MLLLVVRLIVKADTVAFFRHKRQFFRSGSKGEEGALLFDFLGVGVFTSVNLDHDVDLAQVAHLMAVLN